MTEIKCPKCGSADWQAVEQYTSMTPVRIHLASSGSVELEFGARSEMNRDAASSVTTVYICSTDGCGFSVEPLKVADLGGQ